MKNIIIIMLIVSIIISLITGIVIVSLGDEVVTCKKGVQVESLIIDDVKFLECVDEELKFERTVEGNKIVQKNINNTELTHIESYKYDESKVVFLTYVGIIGTLLAVLSWSILWTNIV